MDNKLLSILRKLLGTRAYLRCAVNAKLKGLLDRSLAIRMLQAEGKFYG